MKVLSMKDIKIIRMWTHYEKMTIKSCEYKI